MRNFTTKVNDTAPLASGVLDAAEDDVRFDELMNAVTASGMALDPPSGPDTRTNMLAESMVRHVGAAMACTDSGSANAYVLSIKGAFVAPTALVDEMKVRCKPGHANTTSSTVNAFGLGAKPLVDHTYAPLGGGELDGRDAEFIYRASVGGSGSWVLPAWSNAKYVGQVPASPPSITSGEGWSVDGSNHGNLNFPGLTNLAAIDPTDVFARYVSAGGVNHHRGITGAQLLAAMSGGGGLKGVQLLTTSGTYTPTAGTTKALVFATAGGGAGGGYAGYGVGTAGAGGGAGSTVITFVDLTGISTVAYLIGAGGAGSVGATGGAGGTTSFGSYAVAGGGAGGYGGPGVSSGGDGRPAGLGGTATTGLMKLGGADGYSPSALTGGNGGSSFWGGGGLGPDQPGISSQGRSGNAYGAGGGGCDGPTILAGGAGAPGCILVLEFA